MKLNEEPRKFRQGLLYVTVNDLINVQSNFLSTATEVLEQSMMFLNL